MFKPLNPKLPKALAGLFCMTVFAFLKGFSQNPTIRSSSFAPPINIPTGLHPSGIIMADFDGDGKLDLATPGNYSITGQQASVSVLRNIGTTGAPAFAAAVNLTAGQFTNSLAIGDINGDGKPDLVSTSVTDQTFSVFLNTSVSGAIHFAARTDVSLAQSPTYVAVGDLDGDGKPDVVVVNNLAGTISVFRNTSAGGSVSFAARADYTVGIFPSCVAIGDLDGDGKPDLGVVNNGSNTVSLFRNNSSSGAIALAAKVDLATTAGTDNPFGLALVDVDGDGKSDLVVTNDNVNNITPAAVAFSIFRNASSVGNFSFGGGVNFSTGDANLVGSGDLNGDGKPDLVVATASNDANVVIYQNNSVAGNISLGAPATEFTLAAYATAIGDLDGDGLPDLAVANISGSTVSVFRNKIYEPAIVSVNPLTAAAGITVRLTGANFTGATGVSFGGIPVASFVVVSDTVITAVVGTGAGGNVTVTGPRGVGVYYGFVFAGPPVITSFLPASAAAGTTVTITGFNFDYLLGVSFGGVQAASYTFVSSDTVTAVVGQGGSGNIFLVTSYGNASVPGFAYLPLPVISAFSPVFAGAGVPVTITGQNFTGTTAVTFGGVAASSFTVVNATTILATPGSGGSGNVEVTTGYGVADLAGFTWQAAPTLTGFSPSGGAYGTVITITGSNFENITGLSIGGINYIDNFVLVSPTTIQVTLDGPGTSGDIVVITAGGTVSLPGFVYYNVPLFNTISPAVAGSGMTVTITGSNFQGTTSVTLGGVPVKSFTVVSADTILAIVGNGASGAVIVTNPAGSNQANPEFTFTTAPQVFGYAPDSGVVGTLVTITGGNFSNDDIVYFGGGMAVPKSVTAGQIVVAVPASATFAPVAVVSPSRRQSGYIDQPFSVTFPNGASAFTSASFAGHMEFRTGTKPMDIAVGDIDGDGKADLAVANFVDGTVSVYRSVGSPGKIAFAPKVDLVVGYGAKNIALADMNGDGKLDIVVSKGNDDGCGGCGAGGIVILRNVGQPGAPAFAPAVNVLSNTRIDFMVVGDLDGDGKPDVAGADGDFVISYNGPSGGYGSTLFIFRNVSSKDSIGFEEFDESVTVSSYISGVEVNGMALRDVNQDGKPDIIWGESPGDFIVVLTNNSFPGSMQFKTNFVGRDATEDSYGQFPLPADYYLDGRPDIAASGAYFGNMSNGNFSVAYAQTPGGIGVAADLNGDGRPDQVRVGTNFDDSTISVLKDTAIIPVPFAASVDYPVLFANRRVVVGDLDGDGKPEIIVTNKEFNSFSILRNRIGEAVLPAPVVSGFSPNTGGYSTLVTIVGSNFDQATSVGIGGVPVLSYNVVSADTIMAVVDTGATGSVSVVTPGGAASLGEFTYTGSALPQISSVVPNTAAAGASVVISGVNLSHVTAVNFGTAAASFSIVSPNTIIAVVDTSKNDTVSVVTDAGSASIGGFTFVGTPRIQMDGTNPVCAGQILKLVALPAIAGMSFQWYDGSSAVVGGNSDTLLVSVAGSYSVTGSINGVSSPSAAGVSVTMGANLPAPSITARGDSLFSSVGAGNQWYLDTTVALGGDTSQIFKPGVGGSYAVRYVQDGCPSPFSAIYAFKPFVDTTAAGIQVRIVPNPATDHIVVNFDAPGVSVVDVQFFNRDGLLAMEQTGIGNGGSVGTVLLAPGIYFIKVVTGDGRPLAVREILKW